MVVQQRSVDELISGLQKIWIELTSGCNLACVHCYAGSDSKSFSKDTLTKEEYNRILKEAKDLDCELVRFIGGEPTLNRNITEHIRYANSLGMKTEVFTNLTYLPEEHIRTYVETNTALKISFYSHIPEIHDSITKVKSSFQRTVENIRRTVQEKIPIGAGIIEISQCKDELKETENYLRNLGIENISFDRVRGVGRGKEITKTGGIDELCHQCWTGGLAVTSNGTVHPCSIANEYNMGNIKENNLKQILESQPLRDFRATSYQKLKERTKLECCPGPFPPDCKPSSCNPFNCEPLPDTCSPERDCRPN